LVWNTLINQQLRLFSIQIANLIAASVASFSVVVGGCQRSLALQEKNHENEKMRPMPREVGLRSGLSQYLERPLVGPPEFLFYSM
jgi:hypothetical protein